MSWRGLSGLRIVNRTAMPYPLDLLGQLVRLLLGLGGFSPGTAGICLFTETVSREVTLCGACALTLALMTRSMSRAICRFIFAVMAMINAERGLKGTRESAVGALGRCQTVIEMRSPK